MITRLAVLSLLAGCVFAQAPSGFVQRDGTKLVLDGKPFRYSGPNIEWLGVEGYGPHDPTGPRYPSRFEVDDAFDTAKEMGALVVRSQTMGDSVGCPLCIEPQPGVFNDGAFGPVDYAIKAAHDRGMRVIVTLIGDCAMCTGGGIGQYLAWAKQKDYNAFFSDPALIAAFEKHIAAVVNHRNALTGVRYKDDPTIMAWENCNMCGLGALFAPAKMPAYIAWIDTIGTYIKSLDSKHLYLDTTGLFRFNKAALDTKTPDMITFEYYPHWDAALGMAKTTAQTFTRDAASVTGHEKAYIINEYGWDVTDWATKDDLATVLHTFETDANITGDGFWALEAHADNFGWKPIPANVSDATYAKKGESGHWWALYYGGMDTLAMKADDMRGRAQQLRTHAFAMAGVPAPAHMIPAAPVVTSVVFGSLIAWRGSAGAVNYSVERRPAASTKWELICDRCATDADDPWADPKPNVMAGFKYRVTAHNADGVASVPSEEK